MRSRRLFVLASIVSAFAVSSARGQCPSGWRPGEGLPGINGNVFAVTTWDPDGAGPQPELLVAGGYFSIAGTTVANNIAAWDGENWQPLGAGSLGYVHALTVYDGHLIASGGFRTAGGGDAYGVARWSGMAWQLLGTGMNFGVNALTVYNGELIAGGDFTTAGGVSASSIARWDGTAWQPRGA